jgi:hypothetical protein
MALLVKLANVAPACRATMTSVIRDNIAFAMPLAALAGRTWLNRIPAMDIYNLGKVQSTTDGAGFDIIGVRRRPLVTFVFETQEEADAAHKAMQPIIATAKVIVSHPPPYPR